MTPHLIQNFDVLACTDDRRDALCVLEAGIQAINTKKVMEQKVSLEKDILQIMGEQWDLRAYEHVYVIGIGKAALDAATALEEILGERITQGIVLDVKTSSLTRIKSIAGEHPLPAEANIRATGEIIGILKAAGERDLVLAVFSGGGSALLCWPYKLECGQLRVLTQALLGSGASIQEMNTVRKHLSEIQGGQFAQLAFPATVVGMVFSDVPGDDLSVIASGPTVLDTTTAAHAREILDRYDLLAACELAECELKETPKDPKFFERVTNLLLVNNAIALEAMEEEARRRGYATRIHSRTLQGEAREVGQLLAGLPNKQEMVFAGGETTVKVRGNGRGGRNQELALGALVSLEEDVLVLSCASDGIDNSDVAGAVADRLIKRVAEQEGLDPVRFLAENDSYAFGQKTGGQIITGRTGANISDLMLSMRRS